MKKISAVIAASVAAFGFASTASTASAASTAAKDTYALARQSADTNYQRAQAQCIALTGVPRNVCVAEAEAVRTRATSSAKVQYKGTRQAHANARIAVANADFAVAEAKCESHAGNKKEVCLKEAAAAKAAIKVNATADRKIIAARNEAAEKTLDANYKVALEKCGAYAGTTARNCVAAAKARFAK
jgi:hypothetical protein